MDDGDYQIVGVKPELIERLERGRKVRLVYEVDETLQQTLESTSARVPAKAAVRVRRALWRALSVLLCASTACR